MHYQYKENIINYEIEGHGKPIIILHGLGCDLNMMKACLEPIFKKKSDYKRIYIDLPGMGKSAGNIEDASSDAISDVEIDKRKGTLLAVGGAIGGIVGKYILSEKHWTNEKKEVINNTNDTREDITFVIILRNIGR